MPEWDVLAGDDLRDLVNGQQSVVRDTSCWYPNDVDLVMRYATETGLSPHFADQFHAYLLDNMGLSEEFDEDSPWRFLDEKA